MSQVSLLMLLLRHKYIILTCMVVSTIATISAAYVATPVYRARVVLAPVNDISTSGMLESALGQLGTMAALAGLAPTSDQKTKEGIAVLQSRQFTESLIRDLKLLPVLYARKWDAHAQKWAVPESKVPSLSQSAVLFDRKVRRAYQDRKSGLVILEIEWKDPNQAARWANEIVKRLNAQMRQRAIEEATSSISYLNNQLARADQVELRLAINRLIESQIKQRMLATVNPEFAFRVIDPAAPPDPRDPIRPKKILYAIAGPLIGALMGILIVISIHVFRTEGLPDLRP
jgi:uncharacterized protein involved in exopolysaccharide biosynthesis